MANKVDGPNIEGEVCRGKIEQRLEGLDEDDDGEVDDASWNGVINHGVPSIKIRAGTSLLELMSVIRPQGYPTKTATIGRFFSVGGVYLNPSVHGAIYCESRHAVHVLNARVMDADGQISVYTGDQVKDSRGSQR